MSFHAFRLTSTLVFLLTALPALAQPTWHLLEDSPNTQRHNDAYFVDAKRGWIVNGEGSVYQTRNGGTSWNHLFQVEDGHFRSVGFLDAQRGFVGAIGLGEQIRSTDPNVLYKTTNGGASWTPVTEFIGDPPPGLCGMHVVNDSVVVAVGRVRGPATFVRTTDGGETWTGRNMGAHAAGLIDVYFPHPDSGFAVGLTHANHNQSSCVILHTDDGGATWTERFRSTRTGEWCWKMSWPSRRVGYASLQRNSAAPIYFLKTTDGGETWEEKLFYPDNYFVQGIGFINETHGWIGGNSNMPVYRTTDGGETWTRDAVRPRLNRFRFLGDTLGYAVGNQVYKLDFTTGTATEAVPLPGTLALTASPSPFSEGVHLETVLPEAAPVTFSVFDLNGRLLATQVAGQHPAGPARLYWDGHTSEGRAVAPGRYIVRVQAGEHVVSAVLVRAQ